METIIVIILKRISVELNNNWVCIIKSYNKTNKGGNGVIANRILNCYNIIM